VEIKTVMKSSILMNLILKISLLDLLHRVASRQEMVDNSLSRPAANLTRNQPVTVIDETRGMRLRSSALVLFFPFSG